MAGNRIDPVPDPARSWIDLSPYENDEFGVPRAYVHLVAAQSDLQTWAGMDAVSNAYACDQSIFPTVGSANPVLTGLTLAKRVATALPA